MRLPAARGKPWGGGLRAGLDTGTTRRWRAAHTKRRIATLASSAMTRTTLDHTQIGSRCPRSMRGRCDRSDDGEVEAVA